MIFRFARFSYAISEIYRCWHHIASEEMGKMGLKGQHAVYFTTMYQYPAGITAAQLCDICGKDKADVSRAIALLEEKGLVEKETASKHAYRARLKLTLRGQQLAETINEKAMTAVEYASKGLSEEKRAVFYEALELITCNLQNLSRNGLPTQNPTETEQRL